MRSATEEQRRWNEGFLRALDGMEPEFAWDEIYMEGYAEGNGVDEEDYTDDTWPDD